MNYFCLVGWDLQVIEEDVKKVTRSRIALDCGQSGREGLRSTAWKIGTRFCSSPPSCQEINLAAKLYFVFILLFWNKTSPPSCQEITLATKLFFISIFFYYWNKTSPPSCQEITLAAECSAFKSKFSLEFYEKESPFGFKFWGDKVLNYEKAKQESKYFVCWTFGR